MNDRHQHFQMIAGLVKWLRFRTILKLSSQKSICETAKKLAASCSKNHRSKWNFSFFLLQRSSKKEVGKGAAHLFSLKYTVAVDSNQSNECFMSGLKRI